VSVAGRRSPASVGGSPGSPAAGVQVRPEVAALGRDNERTRRRVDSLEDLVRSLGENLAAVSGPEGPASPGPGAALPSGGGGGVRSWLLAEDLDRAAAALAGLVAWVDRVYLAYHQVSLPSCWLWHPDVVEELWWLCQAHTDAYHPVTGSWLRAGDWHSRQRPDLVRRLNLVLAHCNPERHRAQGAPPRRQSVTPTPDAITAVAVWLTSARSGTAPLPPPDQPVASPPHVPRRWS
jgi:hypothetical protein